MEGQARDLVRFIQDARKSAGFDITDRITVALQPEKGADLRALLERYGDFIMAETLATSISVGPAEEGAYVSQADLDGARVGIAVRRLR